jgi:amidase
MDSDEKISSLELTQLMLNRIAAIDSRLHSYITVMRKDALAYAKAMDEQLAQGKYRGPLHGVLVGVKDLLYTTNAPTTGGMSFKANFIAPYNATVVDRLHNAGAVILGKLNLTEGATGAYNHTIPIPKNHGANTCGQVYLQVVQVLPLLPVYVLDRAVLIQEVRFVFHHLQMAL